MQLTQTHAVLGKYAEDNVLLQMQLAEARAENSRLQERVKELEALAAEHQSKTAAQA